jgi:hypothetical protein
MSRIRDGAEMSSVGVEGVEGILSHIVGAMRSKAGMASYVASVLIIVAMSTTIEHWTQTEIVRGKELASRGKFCDSRTAGVVSLYLEDYRNMYLRRSDVDAPSDPNTATQPRERGFLNDWHNSKLKFSILMYFRGHADLERPVSNISKLSVVFNLSPG